MTARVLGQAIEGTRIGNRSLSLLFGVLLLFYPIDGSDKRIRLGNSEKALKREIQKRIPIGSDIEDAKRVMEANGFECVFMENASLADKKEDGSVVTHDNLDLLWCDRERPYWLFCLRRWQVSLVHEDRVVRDIFVAISLTCP